MKNNKHKKRPDVSVRMTAPDVRLIMAGQAYFWTPEWQAKERAADRAIAEGRFHTFDTIEDMLYFLDLQ